MGIELVVMEQTETDNVVRYIVVRVGGSVICGKIHLLPTSIKLVVRE